MRVAIAGAGIGGMTLAALLSRSGHEVDLVEKASAFGEVGAGIQLGPNATRVLSVLGLDDELARIGTMSERVVLRRWDDDAVLLERPQGTLPTELYGSPYYNVYRPDLVDVLAHVLGGVTTHFCTEAVGLTQHSDGAELQLADGGSVEADVVIGADGIHSAVRGSVFGQTESRFSKSVAFRALIPRSAVPDAAIEVASRLGPERHIVSYFVGEAQRYLNLVCVVPEATWDVEGWNEPASADELRGHFVGWAPALTELLELVEDPVYRWALYDRPPMAKWVDGRVALMGDACHAMLPFMAQGAAQAIEDAAVLSRVLTEWPVEHVAEALSTYERVRQPRAARLQRLSWRNATTYHLPDGPDQQARDELFAVVAGNEGDPFDWLYRHDALTESLD